MRLRCALQAWVGVNLRGAKLTAYVVMHSRVRVLLVEASEGKHGRCLGSAPLRCAHSRAGPKDAWVVTTASDLTCRTFELAAAATQDLSLDASFADSAMVSASLAQ